MSNDNVLTYCELCNKVYGYDSISYDDLICNHKKKDIKNIDYSNWIIKDKKKGLL